MLETRGLYQTNGKRPDGVIMIPWELGQQVVLDVTIVDAFRPTRMNQGSICNTGTNATKAVKMKSIANL